MKIEEINKKEAIKLIKKFGLVVCDDCNNYCHDIQSLSEEQYQKGFIDGSHENKKGTKNI